MAITKTTHRAHVPNRTTRCAVLVGFLCCVPSVTVLAETPTNESIGGLPTLLNVVPTSPPRPTEGKAADQRFDPNKDQTPVGAFAFAPALAFAARRSIA